MPDSQRKKIAIVGNAEVNRDYSLFIDSCDLVVRLNLRSGLPTLLHNRLGKKTDILCYAPRATRLVLDDPESAGQLKCFLDGAKRVWFLGPKWWFYLGPAGTIRFLVRKKRLTFDTSAAMVKALQLGDRQIEYSARGFRQSVARKLQLPPGQTEHRFPSAGMVVIQRVIEDSEFEHYEKYVIGFTFVGWQGHPFNAEKRLVESYSAQGLLQLLPTD